MSESVDIFKNVECNYSFYVFSKKNVIRRFCMKIISHDSFEWIVLTVICIGSVKLAVDTYFTATGSYAKFSTIFNYTTSVLFTIEGALKVISLGFLFDDKSYLRDSWNIMDFAIIIATWLDLTVNAVNIPMIKVLRLFRTFRPLRFVTHNVNMRIIVTALFKSLGAILNTLIVIVVIWFMFSIVGVNFFSGKFQYCTKDIFVNSWPDTCVQDEGEWVTYDHNFDNSINGLMFLYILTTQENWPVLAYQGVDSDDDELGPIKDARWYYAYYFVVFLFIGSMFLLNLFVGVMFLNFTKVQKEETSSFGDILITEDQLNWIEVQKMITKAQPNYNIQTTPPLYNWRKPIHNFVTSNKFEIFVAVIIVLNMLQMAMLYNDASDGYVLMLDIINYVFTGIFTIEIILKLLAYACSFWYDTWNIFDFIVVISSWVDIIFTTFFSTSLSVLRMGPQLLRVLRVLRVSRLLRLIKNYRRLQEIMEIMQLCLPSMMNVFSLLALVLFIFAIMGCYLFEGKYEGTVINDLYNFENFGYGLLLSFKIATGEDWNNFMFDYARTTTSCAMGLGCGNGVAFIYFIAAKFIVSFIMLNLFILVVLELFDKFYFADDNVISQYKDEYEKFQENWMSIGATHSGFMLSQEKLLRFFSKLTGPAGMEGMDADARSREIILMGIRRYLLILN